MTGPLCRRCGKPIAKYTTTVWFRKEPSPNDHQTSYSSYVYFGDKGRPQTKAEAQRYVNQQIVAVKRQTEYEFDSPDPVRDLGIASVSVWDGERYQDDFFCNGNCAQRFGRLMAKEGHVTKAYQNAMKGRSKG